MLPMRRRDMRQRSLLGVQGSSCIASWLADPKKFEVCCLSVESSSEMSLGSIYSESVLKGC